LNFNCGNNYKIKNNIGSKERLATGPRPKQNKTKKNKNKNKDKKRKKEISIGNHMGRSAIDD
jgi:hypothetical protein